MRSGATGGGCWAVAELKAGLTQKRCHRRLPIMILESLPELERLDDTQREVLAVELLQSVRDRQQVAKVEPEIVALLEERRAQMLAEPASVRSWAEVKSDLLARYRGR